MESVASGASVASTSSGATKRPAASSPSGDDEVEVVGEEMPVSASLRPRKKGRGRPAIDPSHEGMFTAAKRLEAEQKRKDEEDEEALKVALDPQTRPAPSKKLEAIIGAEKSMTEDLRQQSTASVKGLTREAVDKIRKVAQGSKNLKGEWQKLLWDATAEMTAACEVLYTRALEVEAASAGDGERRLLREEIRQLQRDNADLRSTIEELRTELRELKSSRKHKSPPYKSPPPVDTGAGDDGRGVSGGYPRQSPPETRTTRREGHG
ncbi:hypothetical protein P5V15_012211 [Pogonomyrmex californicus]